MNNRYVPTVRMLISDYDVAISWYCGVLALFAPIDDDVEGRKRVKTVVLRFCNEAFPFRLFLQIGSSPAELHLLKTRFEGLQFLNLPVDDCHQVVKGIKNRGGVVIGEVVEMPYGDLAMVEDPFGNRIGLREWW